MIQQICSWLMLAWLVFGFFCVVRQDFNGRKAKEPTGFSGFVATCIGITVIAAICYGSGAFDHLFSQG